MLLVVMEFTRFISQLFAELATLFWLLLRRGRTLAARNLFLCKQLAVYRERGVKPRRLDAATRISLVFLSRWFDWRPALFDVTPQTFVRWHRQGFRLFWRWKSKPGRPPIPSELRALIRQMAAENPTWGEERIANEVLFKLRIRISPRTVSKYLPNRPRQGPRGDQRWSTFVRNHAHAIVACDFFVAVTATFGCSNVGLPITTIRGHIWVWAQGFRARRPVFRRHFRHIDIESAMASALSLARSLAGSTTTTLSQWLKCFVARKSVEDNLLGLRHRYTWREAA